MGLHPARIEGEKPEQHKIVGVTDRNGRKSNPSAVGIAGSESFLGETVVGSTPTTPNFRREETDNNG